MIDLSKHHLLAVKEHEALRAEVLSAVDRFVSYKRYYRDCPVDIIDGQKNPNFDLPLTKAMVSKEFEQLFCQTVQSFQIWINLYKHQSYQEPHSHTPSTISFNYFVSVPQDSGDLCFENYAYDDTYEGTLIFFPSSDYHYVTPNETQDLRITVAGNIEYIIP